MPFYDDSYRCPWPHEPTFGTTDLAERVTHLVFVDGRLVDQWNEPVTGTRWEPYAEHLDLERRPPPPPALPAHEQALRWLDALCGGREPLLALGSERLDDDGRDLPDTGTPRDQERLAETWRLLEQTAGLFFDDEARFALRAALLMAWDREPGSARALSGPSHLAGGLLWVVGKANGLLHPAAPVTQRALQEHLGLTTSLSTLGHQARQAMVGWWSGTDPVVVRPWPMPDLLPLGRPELLVSATRERLVRVRDQALAAQRAAAV